MDGLINKLAKFTEMGQNIYNFGFGDYDPVTNDISDTNVSNNQDTDVIMGTLVALFMILRTCLWKRRFLSRVLIRPEPGSIK
jgi:hypothetical protein